MRPPWRGSLLFLVCLLGPYCPRIRSGHEDGAMHNVEVSWDFTSGLEGWANSTAEEMGCEVHSQGGEMRGSVLGGFPPRFDSPVFSVPAMDRHVVVLRMMYHGRATKGLVTVRGGMSVEDDAQSQPWEDPDWVGHSRSAPIPFDIIGDGQYRIYYAAVWEVYTGHINQVRVSPASDLMALGDSFSVDWIRVVKAPTILKVEGCINKYYPQQNLQNPSHNATLKTHVIHRHRYSSTADEDRSVDPSYSGAGTTHDFVVQQTIGHQTSPLPYGTTYNCLRSGGERITLTGTNFGVFDPSWTELSPTVTVNGRPCVDVVMTIPQTQLQCNLPPGPRRGSGLRMPVKLSNGAMPGLYDLNNYLSYAEPAAQLQTPRVVNVAACSVDLVWKPPADYWDALAVSGYRIAIRSGGGSQMTDASGKLLPGAAGTKLHFVAVGNVTSTTVVGLKPGTEYEFQVAVLTEDQDETGCVEGTPPEGASPDNMRWRCRTDRAGRPTGKRTGDQWRQLDLYGRRRVVKGALVGMYSLPTASVHTLEDDFKFEGFNANATLFHGEGSRGMEVSQAVVGPTGAYGGQGHYGLHLVGDANIGNCNASYACCDTYNLSMAFDPITGDPRKQACEASFVCSSIGAVDVHPDYLNERSDRGVATNALGKGIFIGKAGIVSHNATGRCGPALRLTASQARLTGAAWYSRRVDVREGFSTTFSYRVSNPSVSCKRMDDEFTRCRSRGADGLAFVIQNQASEALGKGGRAMGYGGIRNSLAVEIDTMYNPTMMDPFENHVSVQTRGWRDENSAHHTFELGSTAAVLSALPDLTDSIHKVRIDYDPVFDQGLLQTAAFVSSPFVASFLENGDYLAGGMADWGTGMGTISVYVDDMYSPVLVVPLNLDGTLHLDSGRAWVGFTAATGEDMWQAHDILDWTFRSTRKDPHFTAPTVTNPSTRAEAHECSGELPCPHP